MLDGKYEITSERELDARTTLFAATAPDGTALRISWYELSGADEERAFEGYRAFLRLLRREGYAAIYDLVARPGAHYVAWRIPEASVPADPERLEAIEKLLHTHGRSLKGAYIVSDLGEPGCVFDLPFSSGAHESAVALPTPTAQPAQPVDNLWISLWTGFRPWALGCVLALLGLLFALLGVQRTLETDLITVPDVRGDGIGPALAELYRAGFSTEPVPLESSQAPGTVIELNPASGALLRPGRTLSVSYALSAGRAPAAAPRLIGETVTEAEAALGKRGFGLGDIARVANHAAPGTIIAQTPAAGAEAVQGARVHVLVSAGPAPATTFLPDLTGLSLEDALRIAEAAGFAQNTVSRDLTPGSGVATGTVLAQNIKPLFSVPLGARLRLTVAAPSASAAGENGTPDLIGLSLAEAQLQARGAGLSVVQEAQVDAPQLPPGVVLQRPAPGTPLQNRIEVTVNTRAETPASTPDSESRVRRTEYSWVLGPEHFGARATITVTMASGTSDVLIRNQRVSSSILSGVYLTTARGPLTFRLTLNDRAYGLPLTLDP